MSTVKSFQGPTRAVGTALFVAFAPAAAGCSMYNQPNGMGTAAGDALGTVIGDQAESTARGAIIGAVVGGPAGAIIATRMDEQAMELMMEIPGADVQRVGEGIQLTFSSSLMYDSDSDDFRGDAEANLRTLATSLQKYGNTQLLIVGHTDTKGSLEFNRNLSMQRADAASIYLVSQGVGGARIQTSGAGESEPVASNETDTGRRMNQRIEMAIFASDAPLSSSR